VVTTKTREFTKAEYVKMHFVYGLCDGNYRAALREYQHLYSDRWQPYRRVLLRVHLNLRETGTAMTHALAGRGRGSVWNQENVPDTAHGNPSTGIRHSSSATARLSLQHCLLCVRMRCIPFVQSQCKGSGRAHISVYCFRWELRKTTRVHPSVSQFLCRGEAWRKKSVPRKFGFATI
jgi:hypothetical protein